MAAHKGDVYRNVKGIRTGEIKVPDKAFGMDVLRPEEKKLAFFQHMGHVVIRAVPPVADKDIPGPGLGMVPVNHVTEGLEFILPVDGLDQGIGIGMSLQVIERIQVHAVEAFCGMTF